jgi:hypothetical protein
MKINVIQNLMSRGVLSPDPEVDPQIVEVIGPKKGTIKHMKINMIRNSMKGIFLNPKNITKRAILTTNRMDNTGKAGMDVFQKRMNKIFSQEKYRLVRINIASIVVNMGTGEKNVEKGTKIRSKVTGRVIIRNIAKNAASRGMINMNVVKIKSISNLTNYQ